MDSNLHPSFPLTVLEIIVFGISLDLGKSSFKFTFENPMFNEKAVSTAFSFTTVIPASPLNISVLKNSTRLDSSFRTDRLPCDIVIGGVYFFSGFLRVENNGDQGISVYINDKGTKFWREIKELNLRSLDLNEYTVTEESNTPIVKIQDWIDYLNAKTVEDVATQTDHFFPPLRNGAAYDAPNTVNTEWSNRWWANQINPFIEGSYRGNVGLDVAEEWGQSWGVSYSPVIRFMYVLENVCERFGYRLGGSWKDIDDIQQLVIWANAFLDKWEDNFGGKSYNHMQESYRLQDFLPDVRVVELFTALKSIFAVVGIAKNNTIELVDIQTILRRTPEDWDEFIDADNSFKWRTAANYDLTWAEDSKDYTQTKEYFNIQRTEFSTGDAFDKTITLESKHLPLGSSAGPLKVTGIGADNSLYDYTTDTTIGELETVTTSGYNGFAKSDFSENSPDEFMKFMLLSMYRGRFENSAGVLTPVCSHYTEDNFGTSVGRYSLDWNDGEFGLYQNWWSEFLSFLNGSKDMKRKVNLPIHRIKKEIAFENPVKQFYTDNGAVTAVLKKFSFTASATELSATTCEFVAK